MKVIGPYVRTYEPTRHLRGRGRCRSNMAPARQSRLDSGLEFQVLETFPFSLGRV